VGWNSKKDRKVKVLKKLHYSWSSVGKSLSVLLESNN
jgi:hypothetical protein